MNASEAQGYLLQENDESFHHPYYDLLENRRPSRRCVYLLYAENDRELAFDLGMEIENRTEFKVIYHDESFVPGLTVIDNIYYSLEGSEKCIILFSTEIFQDAAVTFAAPYVLTKRSPMIIAVHPLPVHDLLDHHHKAIRDLFLGSSPVEYPESENGRQLAVDKMINQLVN